MNIANHKEYAHEYASPSMRTNHLSEVLVASFFSGYETCEISKEKELCANQHALPSMSPYENTNCNQSSQSIMQK